MTQGKQPSPSQRPPSKDTASFLVGVAAVTRMIRAHHRLSQAEVARRAGVGEKFVSAIEHGRANPSVRRMGQLAEGLGLAGAAELASKAEDAAHRFAVATRRDSTS
ncbi:MAG: helix-turn-helix transcriptional regulator [Conexibacter sp.]